MRKTKMNHIGYSNNTFNKENKHDNHFPIWYWEKGLHDATIISTSKIEVEYCYSQTNPIRNYYIILLDTSKALFDTSIQELRFINASVIGDDYNYHGYWWVSDSVEKSGKKYRIVVNVRYQMDIKKMIIYCDDVIVIRSKSMHG